MGLFGEVLHSFISCVVCVAGFALDVLVDWSCMFNWPREEISTDSYCHSWYLGMKMSENRLGFE